MSSDITNNKSLRILRYLFQHHDSQPHLRGIARDIDVSRSTASRILSKLSKDDIVLRDERGNLTKFMLNLDNFLVIHLCALALALELNDIKENAPSLHRQLESFSDSCVRRLENDIRSIILFGSAAREEHKEKSDVDVLVLMNDLKHTKKIEKVSSSVNASYTTDVSPTMIMPKTFLAELEDGNLLYRNILKDGLPVYGSESYIRTAFEFMRGIR